MDNLSDQEIRSRIASKVKKLYANQKKKYVCEFCGTGFNKKDFLESHMKIRHPEEYARKYHDMKYAALSPDISNQNQAATEEMTSPTVISPHFKGKIDSAGNENNQATNSPYESPQVLNPSSPETPQIHAPLEQSEIQGNIPNLNPNNRGALDPQANSNMQSVNSEIGGNTYGPATLTTLDEQLSSMNDALKHTIEVMNSNMQLLNKELRYLIAEYKSPFIIFE